MGRVFPPLDRIQVEAVLHRAGFALKSHKPTSHAKWEGYVRNRRRVVTVDYLSSRKEKYSPYLLRSMIEQSGLTKDEFYAYLV